MLTSLVAPRAGTPVRDHNATPRPEGEEAASEGAAASSAAKAKQKPKRAPKRTKQIVDAVTELDQTPRKNRTAPTDENAFSQSGALKTGLEGLAERQARGLISPPQYLPECRLHLRLLEIEADPVNYYLPRPVEGNNNLISGAPHGLAPELADLFKFPARASKRKRQESGDKAALANRPQSVMSEMASPGVGRRQASVAASQIPSELGGLADLSGAPFDDFGGFGNDTTHEPFQFELEPEENAAAADVRSNADATPSKSNAARAPSPAVTVFDEADPMARGDGLLSAFDDLRTANPAPAASQAASQAQTATASNAVIEDAIEEQESTAETKRKVASWSKSTVTALRVLDSELGPAPSAGTASAKTLSFQKSADQV